MGSHNLHKNHSFDWQGGFIALLTNKTKINVLAEQVNPCLKDFISIVRIARSRITRECRNGRCEGWIWNAVAMDQSCIIGISQRLFYDLQRKLFQE